MMKVLQIGYGHWGARLTKAIEADTHLDLVGIYTRNPIDHTLYCANLDMALADTSVQGVIIATPLKDRHKLIMRCLDAGKHVLTEKPLAENTIFAQSLIKKAHDQNLSLYTNYTHAHSRLMQLLRDQISDQDIHFIKIIMTQPLSGSHQETVDTLLFSHILAILFDLNPNQLQLISCNSVVLRDRHQCIVQTNALHLCANTQHPERHRVIEVRVKDKIIYIDFSNDGFLSVLKNGLTTHHKLDQSSNLEHVFHAFYKACKSGMADNHAQAIAVQQVLDRLSLPH